jgi:hypothetical protein
MDPENSFVPEESLEAYAAYSGEEVDEEKRKTEPFYCSC